MPGLYESELFWSIIVSQTLPFTAFNTGERYVATEITGQQSRYNSIVMPEKTPHREIALCGT
jgi:hypothetical protein